MTPLSDHIELALGIIALISALVGWLKVVRPRLRSVSRQVVAARDAVLGRDAIVDSITGEERVPALPGIGARMSHQEQQMELLAVTVTKLVDQQTHQMKLEQRVDGLDSRVKQLEEQVIERVAAKAESIQAWRAVEAVAKQADPATPEIED